ncbi:hypothetical protein [Miltoncostaea oceani]|uniref:hypothetical protein n=1 Tax=Miltoncostaea oceani TaxID=2843216 RepID=UPI001C3DBC4A|nr:hypothetical protein [Miltoncostaea oceani]
MKALEEAIRETLDPMRDLHLDDRRLRDAHQRARAQGASQPGWHRAVGVAAAAGGAVALAVVLTLLIIATPSEPTGPAEQGASVAPAIPAYPDTSAGRRGVTELLARAAGPNPERRVRPASIAAVYSHDTRHGRYTVWTARVRDPRIGAVVFSSPRLGSWPVLRRDLATTPGDGLRVALQVRSPAARASEIYGSVAPTVTRVVAVLRNGDRTEALTGGGWFILSVDTGHPAPTRLLAFDASGSRVGEIIPLR